jgi:hypothetical protein
MKKILVVFLLLLSLLANAASGTMTWITEIKSNWCLQQTNSPIHAARPPIRSELALVCLPNTMFPCTNLFGEPDICKRPISIGTNYNLIYSGSTNSDFDVQAGGTFMIEYESDAEDDSFVCINIQDWAGFTGGGHPSAETNIYDANITIAGAVGIHGFLAYRHAVTEGTTNSPGERMHVWWLTDWWLIPRRPGNYNIPKIHVPRPDPLEDPRMRYFIIQEPSWSNQVFYVYTNATLGDWAYLSSGTTDAFGEYTFWLTNYASTMPTNQFFILVNTNAP